MAFLVSPIPLFSHWIDLVGHSFIILFIFSIDLFIPFIICCRYYDKSKIEEEIEEQRNVTSNNWNETKRSLRDAWLSLKPQPLEELHICEGNSWKSQLNTHGEGWYFIATDEFPLLSDLAFSFDIAKMVEDNCCQLDIK